MNEFQFYDIGELQKLKSERSKYQADGTGPSDTEAALENRAAMSATSAQFLSSAGMVHNRQSVPVDAQLRTLT